MKMPNFLEAHRPRHGPLEQLQEMVENKDRAQGLSTFLGHFSGTVETPARPRTLLDMYLRGDVRQIVQDAAVRPGHYTDRQKEILGALSNRGQSDTPITDQEKDELFLTYIRATEADEALRELNAEVSGARHDPSDEIVLEDGRTLTETTKDEKTRATFEAQNHEPDIVII